MSLKDLVCEDEEREHLNRKLSACHPEEEPAEPIVEPTPAEQLYAYAKAAGQHAVEKDQETARVNQRLRQTSAALDRTKKILSHEQNALKKERCAAAILQQRQSTRRKPTSASMPSQVPHRQAPKLGPSVVLRSSPRKATSVKTTIPKRKSYMSTGMPASSLPKRTRRHR